MLFYERRIIMKTDLFTLLLLFVIVFTFVGCDLTFFDDLSSFLANMKTENYSGSQTVEDFMVAYDIKYTSHAKNTKWSFQKATTLGEKEVIEITLKEIDAKYPRKEWLQMLINRGFKIEQFKDYDRLLNLRSDLMIIEFHHDDDSKAVREIHIDAILQKHQTKHQLISEAKKANPDVKDWIIIDGKTHPSIPGRMYVQKTTSGYLIRGMVSTSTKGENGEITSAIGPELSEKQKTDLLKNGIEPEGWEVVHVDQKGDIIISDR
jgi:hypothetical protein